MGRITSRAPIVKLRVGGERMRRSDTLAVEEPLEIRVGGTALAITMRTPGHDVELSTGFLISEGVVSRGDQVLGAIHCGGPGTGGTENTYNVLDVTLAPGVRPLAPDAARAFYTTSSCGVCGKASIDAIRTASSYDCSGDDIAVTPEMIAGFPDRLRAEQAVFDKTGGLHGAALFDIATGELLVLREDVGRHNAVDKVIGWAAQHGRLPLRGTALQVSGRTSFELVQKAAMAGIPLLAAVSAPSSLAVDLAVERGITLIGFLRGETMNIYSRADRVHELVESPLGAHP